MTETYTWTTQRGAIISATITVNHITTKTVNADGFKFEVPCSEWERTIDSLTVNGKTTKLKEFYLERGEECILFDRIGKDRLLIAIPENVKEAIYGEERAETARKYEAYEKAMQQYEEQKDIVEQALEL